MDSSRQVFAVLSFVLTLLMCGAWWFAFFRLRHGKVFLALAILRTVAVFFDAQNLYLAFNEDFLIHFGSSQTTMLYIKILSYIAGALSLAEAVCYLLLVRWLVLRFQTNQP